MRYGYGVRIYYGINIKRVVKFEKCFYEEQELLAPRKVHLPFYKIIIGRMYSKIL